MQNDPVQPEATIFNNIQVVASCVWTEANLTSVICPQVSARMSCVLAGVQTLPGALQQVQKAAG